MQYAAATRNDPELADFVHCFTTIDGVQMHYVTNREPVAGSTPLVLLHGWPQSWYEWHRVMPALAEDRTVIALDLPGLGDSTGTPPSYAKHVLAGYVHELVQGSLGYDQVDVVSHDMGSGVGFAYAADHQDAVRRLVVMDFPLPGPTMPVSVISSLSYHFPFFAQPELPEMLIEDEVEPFLRAFYPHVSPNDAPLTDAEIAEFARVYSRPQVLTGGFDLYRTLPEDEAVNSARTSQLDIPVMLLTQEGGFEFLRSSYAPLVTTPVTGTEVPGAGHWLAEEAPETVVAEVLGFLDG